VSIIAWLFGPFIEGASGFGTPAAGTLILVGVATGLDSETMRAYALGFGYEWPDFLAVIGIKVAILHAITGMLVPLFVVSIMTRFYGKNRCFREGLRVWKFALFAMIGPYLFYGARVSFVAGRAYGIGDCGDGGAEGFLDA